MFRLSKSRKDKQEREAIEICEPPRPRIINGLKRRASNTIKSVAIPQVVTRTPRLSVIKATGPRFSEDSSYSDYPVTYSANAPWQIQRSRSGSDDGYQIPGYFHKSLPREVYDCIVTQLEQIHLGQDQACASCYLEDLHSLSLTNRAWGKAANAVMYRKVLVLANEEHGALPRLKVKGTSRMKLLRRTLRESSELAQQVKELHLPDFQTLYQDATIEQEEILNSVASLVMACPRLERLVGFNIPFSNTFDRLSYALSTRSNLKERTWIFDNTDTEFHEEDEDEVKGHYVAECDPTERFLDLNSSHPELSTLVLHQDLDNSSSPLNFRAIIGTCRSFPQLRNLSITGLPASSFTNLVLNALPSNLRSLRLENLPGITEKGLQRFATSPQATSIQKLALINLEISGVVTLADILSTHLASLEEFSLAQNYAPVLHKQDPTPSFDSPLLRYLHWELRSEASPLPAFTFSSSTIESPESPTTPSTNPEPSCCLATSILAAGIKDNKFPSLRRIRIPHDPQGTIQSLCKPLATALLQPDLSKLALVPRSVSSNGFPRTSDDSAPVSPLGDEMSICNVMSGARVDSVVSLPRIRSPTTIVATEGVWAPIRSRLAAQSRILTAWKQPGMVVRVIDPEGKVGTDRVFGSYIGELRSKITYELRPDEGVTGPVGWMMDMNDLMSCRTEGDGDALECPGGPCGHVLHAGVSGGMVDDLF